MFKSSAYGLLIAAVLLSTQALAGPVKIGSHATDLGTMPLGSKSSGPSPSRHFSIGGTAGITLQPYCVPPRVAVPYCARRGPGAHGKCEETRWQCELNGAADGNSGAD